MVKIRGKGKDAVGIIEEVVMRVPRYKRSEVTNLHFA
jgi:hypothetical protein